MTTTNTGHRPWPLDLLAFEEHRSMPAGELASLLETLIQAERSEARAIGPFLEETSAEIRARLIHMQRVGSRNIAALACLLRGLGVEPRDARAPFPQAQLTHRSFGARLELLRRGQAWVARTIERALPHIGDGGMRDELGVVRESHLLNIGVCRGILVDLGFQRFTTR